MEEERKREEEEKGEEGENVGGELRRREEAEREGRQGGLCEAGGLCAAHSRTQMWTHNRVQHTTGHKCGHTIVSSTQQDKNVDTQSCPAHNRTQ